MRECFEDIPVDRGIEIVGFDYVHQLMEHGIGLEHTAENGLLCLQTMGGDFT